MAFVNIDQVRERLAKAAGEADEKMEEDAISILRMAIVLTLVIGVIGTFILTDLAGALLMALVYGIIVLVVYLGSRGTKWIEK